ncbi:MAG TPA: hypothetical protein VIV06_04235 [Candidatus Limnocylindrales bacterium]
MIARRRARNPLVWLVYGALLGPIAAALLLAAPPGRCPVCGFAVQGWQWVCIWCVSDLRTARAGPRGEAAWQPGIIAGQQPAGPAAPAGARTAIAATAATASPTAAPGPASEPGATRSSPRLTSAADPAAGKGAPFASKARGSSEAQADAHASVGVGPTAHAEAVMLASGIYVGGSESLLPGCRYGLMRAGRQLRIVGPLDVSPTVVRTEHDLSDLSVSAVGARVVISDLASSRSRFIVAFQAIAGSAPEELERRLAAPELDARAQPPSGFLS